MITITTEVSVAICWYYCLYYCSSELSSYLVRAAYWLIALRSVPSLVVIGGNDKAWPISDRSGFNSNERQGQIDTRSGGS